MKNLSTPDRESLFKLVFGFLNVILACIYIYTNENIIGYFIIVIDTIVFCIDVYLKNILGKYERYRNLKNQDINFTNPIFDTYKIKQKQYTNLDIEIEVEKFSLNKIGKLLAFLGYISFNEPNKYEIRSIKTTDNGPPV
jgi:hypothetical protein